MKKIIYLVIIALVVVFLYRILSANPSQNQIDESTADLILYWGNGCPHCETVEKYISDNKLDQKIKITKKEVYYNRQNQIDLETTVKKCPNIDTSQGVGVPFAFVPSSKTCLSGDQPIIDWLASR